MMTGRDLIIYILQNNLEDKPVFENGKFIGFMTTSEAACMLNVGEETVKTWYEFNTLKGIELGGDILIANSSIRGLTI